MTRRPPMPSTAAQLAAIQARQVLSPRHKRTVDRLLAALVKAGHARGLPCALTVQELAETYDGPPFDQFLAVLQRHSIAYGEPLVAAFGPSIRLTYDHHGRTLTLARVASETRPG